MELVYLYIKNHPIIGNKDFNFSSQIRCKLTWIDDKARLDFEEIDFPCDFFPKPFLNISAIIGENGAGKTQLIDFIGKLLTNEIEGIDDFIAVFRSQGKLSAYGKRINISANLSVEIKKLEFRRTPEPFENYRLNGRLSLSKSCVVHYCPIFDLKYYGNVDANDKIVDVSTNFLIGNEGGSYIQHNRENYDPIIVHHFANTLRQLNFSNQYPKSIGKIKIPETVSIITVNSTNENPEHNLSFASARPIRQKLKDKIYDELNGIGGDVYRTRLEGDKVKFIEALKTRLKLYFLRDLILNYFYNLNSDNHWLNLDLNIDQSVFDDLSAYEAAKYFFLNQEWSKEYGEIAVSLFDLICSLIDSEEAGISDLERGSFSINTKAASELMELHIKYIQSLPNFISYRDDFYPFLEIDWRNLSSGEKAYLDIYSRIHHAKEEIEKRTESPIQLDFPIKTVYLLIDEGEIGFHPNWQRSFIQNLIDFLPTCFVGEKFEDVRFQVILTSHSPFIISDLPSDNIIPLGEVKRNLPQTFGANIHTLLAHPFFMRDGTIGEFAKNKIKNLIQVIDTLENSPDKDIKNLKSLINLIGEPILKNQLLLKLREKENSLLRQELAIYRANDTNKKN